MTVEIPGLRLMRAVERVEDAIGFLASVLLRSLEQGPLEERLAKVEAALAANAQQAKGAQIP